MNPDDTNLEETWQVMQSKTAIGSGGFFGKGLGEGAIKQSGLLPVQESDFIFAIVGEELGFVGGLALISAYFVMIWRIWRTIALAKEYFGAIMCVGFMCMFAFQVFENIGMTMGLMPITGITLPFMSAGGTSVLANMIAIGLIIGFGSKARTKLLKNADTESTPADRRRTEFSGLTR
jgi:rod shape determining protein RodA